MKSLIQGEFGWGCVSMRVCVCFVFVVVYLCLCVVKNFIFNQKTKKLSMVQTINFSIKQK